jgi:hypothetical protein
MGVGLTLRRVPAAELDRLLVASDDEVYWFLTGEEKPRGFLAKLLRPGSPRPPRREPGADEETDLEKAWHGIHYCLAGAPGPTDTPRGRLLDDRRKVGSSEVFLGIPWALTSDEVSAFATAIEDVTKEALRARYDPEAMVRDKIYLSYMYRRDGDEGFEYIWEYFVILRDFLCKASAARQAVILSNS